MPTDTRKSKNRQYTIDSIKVLCLMLVLAAAILAFGCLAAQLIIHVLQSLL